MSHKVFPIVLAIALAAVLTPAPHAQLTPYSQDFEGLDQADPAALFNDGWLVFANVFSGVTGNYRYGYGPFPAPNGGAAFSAIDAGQGGVDQGAQQLSVYSDYNNGDHGIGDLIEANVFQEQVVDAGDVGQMWVFKFDAKRGNINDPDFPGCPCSSTALAFIKTLDPAAGFALTNFITVDTTDLPDTWGSFELSIAIDASLPGQILQIGFLNTATLYEPSGVLYDNVSFAEVVTGACCTAAPECTDVPVDQCLNSYQGDGTTCAEADCAGPLFVTLCHMPPGNPANGQTITTGFAALQAHLTHGDTFGPCAPSTQNATPHSPGRPDPGVDRKRGVRRDVVPRPDRSR